MRSLQQRADLTKLVSGWRSGGERVAVVPTMGNLHDGHLSLVRIAQDHADRVVVSLFVNPTQFGKGEDFATYPRSLDRDTQILHEIGADALFAPDVRTIYPFGVENATRVSVPGLTDDLCGAGRPGHFDGVTTVLTRLFTLSQPDVAVFGQKDYQQKLVVQRLVEDLGLPIEIVAAPIVREPDGLAMSSRNSNLSVEERKVAPVLYQQLQETARQLQAGQRDFHEMEQQATSGLRAASIDPEYFTIRQSKDLMVPDTNCVEFVVLTAAHFGKVRLIDNVTATAQ
jgi:pantoate--beta-alanine ligase